MSRVMILAVGFLLLSVQLPTVGCLGEQARPEANIADGSAVRGNVDKVEGSEQAKPESNTAEDSILRVSVDKVETSTKLPGGISEELVRSARQGNEYCLIVVSFRIKPGGYVKEFPGFRLMDSEGNAHDRLFATFAGGTFKDRSNINSTLYFGSGAKLTLLYEVPRQSKGLRLSLSYVHVSSMDDDVPQEKGQLDVAIAGR